MLRALLSSRKFWLAVVGLAASAVVLMLVKEPVTRDRMLASIHALIVVLIAAIAYEGKPANPNAPKPDTKSLVLEAVAEAFKAASAGSVAAAAQVLADDAAKLAAADAPTVVEKKS